MRKTAVACALACAGATFTVMPAIAQATTRSKTRAAVTAPTVRPAVKGVPYAEYEFCGSIGGCSFERLYPKTKTWKAVGTEEEGTYTTGPKGALTEYYGECVLAYKKVRGTKNYAGSETGPASECLIQDTTLTFITKGKEKS